MNKKSKLISVVIPVYNERENLKLLVAELLDVLAPEDSELIFVDDGSSDGSMDLLTELCSSHDQIIIVRLSRNFGHQAALRAGLDKALGDCVITMDADLEHPPKLIKEMVELWRQGFDVVSTIRHDHSEIRVFKKLFSNLFYKLVNAISETHFTQGTADFRLLDRKVVDLIKPMAERDLFMRGMVSWLGFRQVSIPYDRGRRHAGDSKFSYRKMFDLSISGITSFSERPLILSVLFGVVFAGLSFSYFLYALYAHFFAQTTLPGWTSVIASLLLVGGVQLLVLGVIGIYIGKLVQQVKARPSYVISDIYGPNRVTPLIKSVK